MKQELNPSMFIDQMNEIKEQAIKATIELLKNNPKGRYLYEDELGQFYDESWFDTATGDDIMINISAVGLDDNDHLIFKAEDVHGGDYEDGEWFEFDEFVPPYTYAEVYKFVAMNLEFAKEKSECEDND
jgi:hypothetical protein